MAKVIRKGLRKGVRIIDHGWDRIMRFFWKYQSGIGAQVGIQGVEAMANREGISNAELAAVHEYGTKDGRIPERSFLRSTFDEELPYYKRTVDRMGEEMPKAMKKGILEAAFVEGELMLIGEEFRKDILDNINRGIYPYLKPVTIKRKDGETTPLINSGQLRSAISTAIVKKWRATS